MNKKLYSDWRLPTIKELLTLVNHNKCNPACDLKDTHGTFYWSSSLFVGGNGYVWIVGFMDGVGYWGDKSYAGYVRCVRDGEKGLEWSASSKNPMVFEKTTEYIKTLTAPVYYK